MNPTVTQFETKVLQAIEWACARPFRPRRRPLGRWRRRQPAT